MAEYTKDKSFSGGWVVGGACIMILTNLLGGFMAAGAQVKTVETLIIVALVCFALGGFVIGWKSEGQTILEAGLAAILALVVTITLRGGSIPTDPVALLIGFGIPFAAAVIGAWIGEKVQGDIIRTED